MKADLKCLKQFPLQLLYFCVLYQNMNFAISLLDRMFVGNKFCILDFVMRNLGCLFLVCFRIMGIWWCFGHFQNKKSPLAHTNSPNLTQNSPYYIRIWD